MTIPEQDPSGGDEVQDDPLDTFFFTDAAEFQKDYLGRIDIFREPKLRKSAIAFAGNIERVRWFARVPGMVMGGAAAHYFLISAAADAVLQRPYHLDSQIGAAAMINRKAIEFLSNQEEFMRGREMILHDYKRNIVMFNKRQTIPRAFEGFRYILAAQVSGVYSAFEIFAKDAWVAAVDHFPQLSNQRFFKDKSVKLGRFPAYKYDFRRRMGRFLAKTKRVEFDSLDGIKDAYDAIVPKAAFTAVFSAPDMRALSEIRNVIAHNAGIADGKYAKRMKNNQEWKAFAGEYIPIDGRKARAMTNLVIESAIKIANGLDQHLRIHRE